MQVLQHSHCVFKELTVKRQMLVAIWIKVLHIRSRTIYGTNIPHENEVLKTKRQEIRVAKRRSTDHGRITTLSSVANHYGSSKTEETSKIGSLSLLPSLCSMLPAMVIRVVEFSNEGYKIGDRYA